ncbi:MAG: phosphate/phosphite/phosphonate ABC transporter substrate-binding protein [Anaerolineales bacterium]|nr:phosphate/phosphite/phosphonate ABC transporter substrate-binding protein [Anaerolineales bacterium]
MRIFWKVLYIGAMLLVLVACSSSGEAQTPEPTAAVVEGESRVIVLGDISDDPAEVIDGTQPLADYLAAHLKEFGITSGQVRVASSISEMAGLLKSGEVDLYFDSTYPATLISDEAGANIILRRWRFGVEQYHSVIFASVDSGVTSLNDLPGHMIAMDAPYSTSGYMLPAVLIVENGLNLVGKRGQGEPVAGDEIGFIFSYDDENTLQWVLSGLVSAGVTDDYHFDVAFPPEATQKLIELARTEATPRQVVVARNGLDPALLDVIKRLLINIHVDETGQDALEAFQTTRFDEFPEGIEQATSRMRKMMDIVRDIPLP